MEKKFDHFTRINKKLFMQTAISVLLLVVVNWFLITIVRQQMKQFIAINQTVAGLKEENASVSQTVGFLADNSDTLAQFSRAVPNEEQFLNFVTSVEKASKEFSSDPSLRFGSTVPIKDKNNLFVPFSLSFTTTTDRISPFLRRFEKLPYLIQILSFSIEQTQESTTSVFVQVSARVYVQNPFSN